MQRKLLFLLCLALIAAGGYFLFGKRSGEPSGEQGQAMVEVVVPPLDGTTKLGERAYNENCASCHGSNAAGQQGIAPPLVHKIYEPSHHADGSFFLAVKQGVRAHHWQFGNMPPVEGLTRRNVELIVAYVRLVQRANGIY
ncbi:cytochrome c [Labrenzia sp. PHM005]|uniref:c-type cytochrome n=1 Tax=Labrenzia sp. PHM005 TaxID=2590016 RepID=UPI0011407B67|nr:cytochrome c [Labrenzia sp. PHM005]QDG78181.1 cytochrome c [Labrenzia sp. PHM005]